MKAFHLLTTMLLDKVLTALLVRLLKHFKVTKRRLRIRDHDLHVQGSVLQPESQVPVQMRGREAASEVAEDKRKRKSCSALVSAASSVRDVTSCPLVVSVDLRPCGSLAPKAFGVL